MMMMNEMVEFIVGENKYRREDNRFHSKRDSLSIVFDEQPNKHEAIDCCLARALENKERNHQKRQRREGRSRSSIVEVVENRIMGHDHGFEEEEEGGSFYVHLIGGAVAGVAEHVGMYPIDTVKTHIQSAVRPGVAVLSGFQTTKEIVTRSGVGGLFRGVTAVAAGAAPSHALHFAIYEHLKEKICKGDKEHHHPLKTGAAGAFATMISEAVASPMDAVKQRMQLQVTTYNGLKDCMRKMWVREGLKSFYAGYTTSLVMNVPYYGTYFASYESLKKVIEPFHSKDRNPLLLHLVAGGGAGVVAAAVTNPFDVAKTRLQTAGDVGKHYNGLIDAMRTIWREEGPKGYLCGIRPHRQA
ncbi:mitochondrial substrate carrier family protein [Cavenderia fasciculata]|uniref:Mitochondrial substrate carrier family protein n=1 Tax=Cavenderia fasciculata TaxID=261658 RepID=F4PXQ7_CACFS|nr:mitochondrial substrate carrier family protein [Cavenderia fasciculata]EGG19567.1 mitochondrial substrate carrier family protein [Cavenderia fasciculata]|eukprot:XP_004357861.1 mitochondrial substrate carrier family protein [Cavenderia fasciculata]